MPLAQLQAITGEDAISMVAISNTGTTYDSLANGEEIVAKLKTEFAGDPIGVNAIKQDTLDQAALASSAFTSLFVVFGLFSIGVGILLIILIFSMLAAERRSEMGMARAVGAQRAQLVQQFLSEGTIYALLAGLVGAFLGVGAAYLIAFGLGRLFGDMFDIEPYVSPRSMIVAYCLGVVITFIAVVYASIRNSRLNIVAAIRDIPDVSSPVRKKRTLVIAALALVIGALLTVAGLGNNSAFPAYAGLSILPVWGGDDPAVLRGFQPASSIRSLGSTSSSSGCCRTSSRKPSSASSTATSRCFSSPASSWSRDRPF